MSLLFQNEDVGYSGRHSLSGSDGNPWVHRGWTGGVTNGLEVMMGLVMIDINGAPLPNLPRMFGVGCCPYTDFVT